MAKPDEASNVTRQDHRFATRCRDLPTGHWHCKHGHLQDCPDGIGCPRIDDSGDAAAYILRSGNVAWVFTSERRFRQHHALLRQNHADVQVINLTAAQTTSWIRLHPDLRIEDWRG